MTTKRIMRAFKMHEISGVDRPAQVHARMAFLKRNGLPANTGEKGENDMDPKELQKKIDDAVKAAVDAAVAKSNEEKAAIQQALDTANTVAKLNDAERTHYSKLNDTDKVSFLAKSETERKAIITKATEGDEVIKVDGTEIRKSDNPSLFAVIKSQQTAIEKQADDLRKANEATALAGFAKRAETELGQLPGETMAKANVLKSVASMPEADRTALDVMLKAGNAALVTLMKSKGRDGTSEGGTTAADKLNKLADDYSKANKVNFAKAMTAVLETEEGAKLYNEDKMEKRAA